LNAEAQEKDPSSVLNYFRKMVELRKSNPVLVYGKYTLLDKKNPDVYAYTRELDGSKMLVLLNFTSKKTKVKTGINTKKASLLINNYEGESSVIELRPYEAAVYQLEKTKLEGFHCDK
jgi:oligo-1,6-glucosidase